MSPDPYKRSVQYTPPVRGYEEQLELQLNNVREATPEEVRQWEQEDFFRAGNFDAMKLFVVFPTIIQLLALAFMFSVFLFNDSVF
jgi:hypothetical protein